MWGQDWITKKIYSAICSDIPEACVYIDKLNEIAGEKLFGFCLDTGHLNLLGLDPHSPWSSSATDLLRFTFTM